MVQMLDLSERAVEIPDCNVSSRAFRERSNSAQLVCRLPSEVTAHVFLCLSGIYPPVVPPRHVLFLPSDSDEEDQTDTDEDEPESEDGQNPFYLGWIAVSHVCRSWRNVALTWPHLWSNIPPTLSWRWAQEMAYRAHATDVYYVRKESVRTHEARGIGMHLAHIAELDIIHTDWEYTDPEHPPRLFTYLERPAPRLQRLALRDCWFHEWRGDPRPVDLLAGDAPLLREVKLNICPVPWGSRIFRNLVSLEIGLPECLTMPTFVYRLLSDTHRRMLAPSLEQLADIFSNCAGTLQTCDLDLGVLPLAADTSEFTSSITDNVVHLPQLTKLKLRALTTNFVELFRAIQLPAQAQVMATCFAPPDDDALKPAHLDVIPILGQHTAQRHSTGSPYKYLCIKNTERLTVTLSSDTENLDIPGTIHVSMELPGDKARVAEAEAAWVNAFTTTVPLDTVTEFEFFVKVKWSGQWSFLTTFAALMPEVNTLVIKAIDTTCDSALLAIHLLCSEGDPPFPRLEKLVAVVPGGRLNRESAVDQAMALVPYVHSRRARGLPLKEVVIKSQMSKGVPETALEMVHGYDGVKLSIMP